MIDLDKFLSLFYERDDPVMCYVWMCVLCVVCFVFCVVYGVLRSVGFGLVCFSFLFFSFPFYDFWAFLFSFFSWVGRRLAWNGIHGEFGNRRSHIPIFRLIHYRHD